MSFELPNESVVEHRLRTCRLPPPSPELKRRVLDAAAEAWLQGPAWQQVPVWAPALLEFAAAAVILIAGLQINALLTGPAQPIDATVAAGAELAGDACVLFPLRLPPRPTINTAALTDVLRDRQGMLRDLLPNRASTVAPANGPLSLEPTSSRADKIA